jgi:hypothetical protein
LEVLSRLSLMRQRHRPLTERHHDVMMSPRSSQHDGRLARRVGGVCPDCERSAERWRQIPTEWALADEKNFRQGVLAADGRKGRYDA